ncbi:MAG: hypothetical protein M3430_00235 [Acidobacteriota bacterium]|nr:hypothetical protein [Acidobacteriota bacterium]
MTNQYTDRSDYGERYEGRSGGGETGGARGQTDDLNMGSARSYYGKNAYGGRLDKRGMDDSRGRRWKSFRRGGERSEWWGKGLMALGGTVVGVSVGIGVGVGIGLAAMYMLDPDQGKRRRESARGKLTDASRKASDVIGKSSRELRDRAQGMLAGARKGSRTDEGASRTRDNERALTVEAS